MTSENTAITSLTAEKSSETRMFIAAKDLSDIVKILVEADKITPEEAARRLNAMCERGVLMIMPMLGRPQR